VAGLPDPVLLIGGGRMGGALLAGWLERGLAPEAAFVVEPDAGRRSDLAAQHPGVRVFADAAELPADLRPAVTVVAVKPQVLDAVLPAYREVVRRGGFVLSIVAGRPIAAFTAAFGKDVPVVRTMPNTPAAVGRGMTVLCAGPGVDSGIRAQAEALMAAVGETAWVEDEDLLHAVTAVSGSGPAYVFLLAEALERAARDVGLDAALARRLARATVSGAGELLARSPEDAAKLRRDVTSPGGTTEAALAVLMREGGLFDLLAEAVRAAKWRSRELAG